MTTITLNERTQAGKTLFELAQKLAVKNNFKPLILLF